MSGPCTECGGQYGGHTRTCSRFPGYQQQQRRRRQRGSYYQRGFVWAVRVICAACFLAGLVVGLILSLFL